MITGTVNTSATDIFIFNLFILQCRSGLAALTRNATIRKIRKPFYAGALAGFRNIPHGRQEYRCVFFYFSQDRKGEASQKCSQLPPITVTELHVGVFTSCVALRCGALPNVAMRIFLRVAEKQH